MVATALTFERSSDRDTTSGACPLIGVLGIPIMVTAGVTGLAAAQAASAMAGAEPPWPVWRQDLRQPLDRVVTQDLVRSGFPCCGECADDHQIRFCAGLTGRRCASGGADVGEPGSIGAMDATQGDLPPCIGPSAEVIEPIPAITTPPDAS